MLQILIGLCLVGALALLAYQNHSLKKRLEKSLFKQKEAERLSEVKSTFLAHMSHEIRTPLASMMGFTRLLEDDDLPVEIQNKYVKIILNAGANLTDVINDILDISKIESGHLTVKKVNANLSELLEDIGKLMALRCIENGLRLDIHCREDVPVHIQTDPLRLKQILLNLIGNAVKFTSHGWIKLEVSSPKSSMIQFDVRDSGVGIPEEAHELIFEPFKQGDSSHFGGTGLGLPLSRYLAELLGGSLILVHSGSGQGAHFRVQIQSQKMENQIDSPSTKKTGPRESIDVKNLKILAVDDSEDSRCLIKTVLEHEGCLVSTAANGKEALEKIEGDSYDVILMDLQMPIMGGIQAVRQLRERGVHTPVIALTASAMSEDAQACERAGFNAFQSKPIQFDHLIYKVSGLRPPFH